MKDFIVSQAKKSASGFSPCIKQHVYAMIETIDGKRAFGMNKMLNHDITICPRVTQRCVSGQGYHLCKDVCKQISHAEVDAISNATKMGLNLKGSKLTLVGHTYCCDNCKAAMIAAGIVDVEILGLL